MYQSNMNHRIRRIIEARERNDLEDHLDPRSRSAPVRNVS